MKKLALALVAAMSLSTAAFAATEVAGSTGQIKFTGQITEAGCTIVTGNSATINLGSMSVASMDKIGNSGWSQGQIKFENCNLEGGDSKLTSVELTIKPGTTGGKDDAWFNEGDARGVGVQIQIAGDEPAVPVPPAGLAKAISAKIDPVNDTAVYTVSGRMVKTFEDSTKVGAGSVETTMTFVASYK
ncbi:hypothetical protein GCM10007162_10600 [Ignatzschineria ureiclastica]|nr:fimbrial protein [Ignatzschineria ureiclastica]GGZ96395.1 hypothetical protein GCM10007162_10600 [Ignatzschineria ureiclastica]